MDDLVHDVLNIFCGWFANHLVAVLVDSQFHLDLRRIDFIFQTEQRRINLKLNDGGRRGSCFEIVDSQGVLCEGNCIGSSVDVFP